MSLDLKKILGDELVKKLEEAELMSQVQKQVEAANLIEDDGNYVRKDTGDYIPKEKFNEERNKLKQQLEQRDKDIQELQDKIKAGGNAAELMDEMKRKHKEETDNLNQQLKKQKLENATEVALLKAKIAKPKYVDLLKPEVLKHADKFVELEDGKFTGIEDVVSELKKSEDFKPLFGEIRPNGEPPEEGKQKDEELTFEGKKANELTLTDRMVLKSQDPAKFQKMFSQE